MESHIYGLTKAYVANGNNAMAVVIPKELCEKLGISKGTKFIVRIDKEGRIIYEPNKKE